LTIIAQTSGNPLFHEAVVWYPPTDDVFFVQNAGAPAAGTGLNKSAIVQKVNLGQVGQALAAGSSRNVSGQVTVQVVNTTKQVVNPNGELFTSRLLRLS
jgi:gluconolactonase